MNKELVQLIIAIVGLAMENGPAAAMAIVAAFEKQQITLDDIEGLKALVKPPEEYGPTAGEVAEATTGKE